MQLTKIIKKYGFKLKDVERDLGYSSGSLRSIFVKVHTGVQKGIGTELLYKIADHIGCHPAEFLLDDPTTFNGKVIEHDIPIQIKEQSSLQLTQPVLDIKAILKKSKVSQKELAARLGVTTVGMLYMIKNKAISVERLYQIANALGVKITDLFIYK